MGRRVVFAVLCTALAVGSLALADPAGAKKVLPVVTGVGKLQCTAGGKVKFGPGLVATATSNVRAKFKGNVLCSSGATNTPGAKIVAGKLTGNSEPFTGSCKARMADTIHLEVFWKRVNKLPVDGTQIDFTASVANRGASARYVRGVVSGSYAGEYPEATLQMPAACGAGKVGTTATTFTFNLHVDHPCVPPIANEIVPAVSNDPSHPRDGFVWWVLISPCNYTAANHPTGTVSWSYGRDPRNGPECTGTNVPLIQTPDTQMTPGILESTPWVSAPNGLWAAPTDIDFAHGDVCYGNFQVFNWSFSGDSRYRASHHEISALP